MSEVCFFFFILKILFIFRGRGRDREKNRCTRETSVGCLSCAPSQETGPATQACALTGNRTGGLLLCRMMTTPLSHTSQGRSFSFIQLSVLLYE